MERSYPVRVALIDDHPIFRDGLKALLSTDRSFQVVGVSGDGVEAVRMITELLPDLVLLDVAMPPAGGLEVLQQVGTLAPSVRTLLLTASVSRDTVLAAVQLGVWGVLLKEHASALLFESMRAVMQGRYWLDREYLGSVIAAMQPGSGTAPPRRANRFNLTTRELQVISAVKAAESNREIAARLSVREDTVKHHLSNIFDKLGVFSRVELAVFAINHGLDAGDMLVAPPAERIDRRRAVAS